MPSYKTHSIHGEIILPSMSKYIDINEDDFKTFCIGPDILIPTDNKIFNLQHEKNVRFFFLTLINEIKKNKLYENTEVMAYLYGQIDHYILDLTTHPLIYHMTENEISKNKIDMHGIMEMWLDDYIMSLYKINPNNYYKKNGINSYQLIKLINKTYSHVYKKENEALNYSTGIFIMKLFDEIIRNNNLHIAPYILDKLNIGDIIYHTDNKRVIEYLNLNNKIWNNPETGLSYNESFNDLWKKSIESSLETIEDVNNYIYKDKELRNKYILNDLSYNTGLPCLLGQTNKYVRKR